VTARLASAMLVNALVRRANQEGGFATILARGDDTAGALIVIAQHRGEGAQAYERGIGPAGKVALIPVGPTDDPAALTDYWQRRRRNDPDLWVVEVDVPFAERFAAETIL
jgi:hypothetical protein